MKSTASQEKSPQGIYNNWPEASSIKQPAVYRTLPFEMKQVVIVGAGLAGLAAARTIQAEAEGMIQIIVLESGEIAGGRARTGTLPSGTPVEFGATWLHGIKSNPLYDIAVWEGLVKDLRDDPSVQKHDIDWQLHFAKPTLPGGGADLLSGRLREIALDAVYRFTEAAEECNRGVDEILDPGASVGEHLRQRFDEAVASLSAAGLSERELEVFVESWICREKLQRTFDGFYSTDDVSLSYPAELDVLDGPNMPFPGLIPTLSHGWTRYKHRVSAIEYGAGGVLVSCENGQEFDPSPHSFPATPSHMATMLVPSSRWSNSLACMFKPDLAYFDLLLRKPALPERKQEWKQAALSAIRLGVADKIFVEFEIDSEVGPPLTKEPSPPETKGQPRPATSADSQGDSQNPNPQPLGHGTEILKEASDHSTTRETTPESTPRSSELGTAAARSLVAKRVNIEPPPTASMDTGTAAAPGLVAKRVNIDTPPTASMDTGTAAAPGLVAKRVNIEPSPTAPMDTGPTSSSDTARLDASRFKRVSEAQIDPLPEKPMSLLIPCKIQATSASECNNNNNNNVGGSGNPAPYRQSDCGRPSVEATSANSAEPTESSEVPNNSQLRRKRARRRKAKQRLGMQGFAADMGAAAAYPGGKEPTQLPDFVAAAGQAALDMESLSDDEVQAGITNLLRVFPQIPLPAGAKLPPHIVRTKWGTDPDFLGSYSYIRRGVCDGSPCDLLAEPLCDRDSNFPLVLFGGESTNREHMGTAHGAFLSGCREGDRLIEAIASLEAPLFWAEGL
eukprot:gene482-1888_t